MTSSEGRRGLTSIAEITVITGDRYRVEGDVKDVERTILDAARGSILQLAWFRDAGTGEDFAVNPEHVVRLRAVES
jgi:hypothetical protein